jgi:hypothetical protein
VAERREVRPSELPSMRAETFVRESRFYMLGPHPDYRHAMDLLGQAVSLDLLSGESDEAHRTRMLGYEVRLQVMGALETLWRTSQATEDRLTLRLDGAVKEQRSESDAARRESLQLLGLLAAVVGLVTSMFVSARQGDPQSLIVAALSASASIAGFLVVFSILQGLRIGNQKWRIAAACVLLCLLLGGPIFVWKEI